MTKTKLSVNLNKVALLRNARTQGVPSVLDAARTAVGAGAHGVTVHPRPDGRHIRADDVRELAALVASLGVELNVEGNPTPPFIRLVDEVRPTQVTLVPDAPEALTSDHGWVLADRADPAGAPTADFERLVPIVQSFQRQAMRVSVFLDPDPAQVGAAARLGADRIELYTEPYARAFGTPDQEAVYGRFRDAAGTAGERGLGVNAGHDLNLDHLARFVTIADILEVSIGHALIADALYLGLAAAVSAYLDRLRDPGLG